MAQVFASREKYYENKVANFSDWLWLTLVFLFGFLISTNCNDASNVVNE